MLQIRPTNLPGSPAIQDLKSEQPNQGSGFLLIVKLPFCLQSLFSILKGEIFFQFNWTKSAGLDDGRGLEQLGRSRIIVLFVGSSFLLQFAQVSLQRNGRTKYDTQSRGLLEGSQGKILKHSYKISLNI